ncbi:NAD(P)/FAD-dependent oxidoreductase [Pseudoduganella danionis]|uniref:NAD(P)/FAD-dependent oxidoreductase n=1 Tax=Pseudoduganella danionis TaxID=1890295 RepID=UPI0035B14329
MLRINELKLPLNHAEAELPAAILQRLGIPAEDLLGFTVYKRSYDARKKSAIVLIYALDVALRDEAAVLKKLHHDHHVMPAPDTAYKFVATPEQLAAAHAGQPRPVVIGTGPCGLFAALILAQMGLRPIILERGKQVRDRTVDTFGFWRKRKLNPESNVQFGEGGAGTFSDGKLYSQIKDPKHYGRKVLTEFVQAGAPEEIIYVSKPHIGTFRLVKMVEQMRANIEAMGGEYHFESKVVDLDIEQQADGGQIRGVVLENGQRIATNHLVLAVGHSARDTFEMLYNRGVYVEAKPFSIGFRVEHPQSLIDQCRFGPNAGHPILGAADYKLVYHASNGRAVYSFCMCPGGTVVAAASEPGRVVTNGMSQYSRNERNANSAIVVSISPEVDYPGHPLAGIAFQRELEAKAFQLGGANYNAPGQLMGDFVAGRPSTAFGSVVPSFKPGVHLTDLAEILPEFAVTALREAFPAFDKQIKGYFKQDAVLTGLETRTSSPVRIKRRDDTLQSLNTRGLFPAGEGAGYAGGILSAGVDGIKVAEAVAQSILAGTAK